MWIQRVYKKYNIDEIKQDSFVLWESLVSLNQTWLVWIPYKIWSLFLHILPKNKDQDIGSLLPFYNTKDISLKDSLSKILEVGEIILDIEYNYSQLYKNRDEEFKEYIHPVKQKRDLQEELYKTINVITKKVWVNDFFTLVFSKNVQSFKNSYIEKYKICDEEELEKRVVWKNYILWHNTRDRNTLKLDIFNKLLVQLRTTERYKRLIWELGVELIEKRLQHEVTIIQWDQFIEYFLNYLTISQFLRQRKIIFFLKGSAVGSLLLYLFWISNINPITHEIPFERFLSKWKIADIDIDIPSSKRDEIILWLNDYFKKSWQEVLLILNKSSNNFDKFTEHPSGILIEETSYINSTLPLQSEWRETLTLRTSQLYDSSTTPVLEEYGYLKYDFLRSQVLEELQHNINQLGLDFYTLLNTWETIPWSIKYNTYISEWSFFQVNSASAKELVLKSNPQSYFDLVKIIACNRPALMRLYNVNILSSQLKLNTWISLRDKEIERIVSSSKSWKILLFQDQVIALLLNVLPDVDYGSVIKLVKARWEVLWTYKKIFLEKCEERIGDKKYSEELWTQIENFDQYGLNKAHSASYWLVTYLQLYVKLLSEDKK